MTNTESSLRQQLAGVEDRSSTVSSVELRRLRRERDELRDAVTSFETELVEIQTEARTLAEDRDNFKLLYEQVSIFKVHTSLYINVHTCKCTYMYSVM